MNAAVIDGENFPAAVERRAGRLFVTVARAVVPPGAPVTLDGVAYTVAASRDPYDAPAQPAPAEDRTYRNADERRRAEARRLADAEALAAKTAAQTGRYCEMELSNHGTV